MTYNIRQMQMDIINATEYKLIIWFYDEGLSFADRL